mgnify:CR=1 FL=1|tara:strand:- start:339 stop:680 length:342 start_codon:yes stop_codon:yes gene_type:complete
MRLLILLILTPWIFSSENEINKAWCSSVDGNDQYITKYGTYVDCLTEDYAIEAEFDYKWKEAIGQSLHYAEATNKNAAILLIKRKQSNKDYYSEMMSVIIKYDLPIKVFLIDE